MLATQVRVVETATAFSACRFVCRSSPTRVSLMDRALTAAVQTTNLTLEGVQVGADNHTTIVGNLVEDPEVRFTQSGIAVTNLRVAVTQRIQQDGQ
jgi:hypothetical protein